jgi:small GTP-binding protein
MLIERDHIGIFGKMNSGKSSVMNLLTQQVTSIVDATPGTTADTKIALQEIHGMGPVKLFDTAGLDEASGLGQKKRAKVFADLKECDLVLLVIDPETDDFPTHN